MRGIEEFGIATQEEIIKKLHDATFTITQAITFLCVLDVDKTDIEQQGIIQKLYDALGYNCSYLGDYGSSNYRSVVTPDGQYLEHYLWYTQVDFIKTWIQDYIDCHKNFKVYGIVEENANVEDVFDVVKLYVDKLIDMLVEHKFLYAYQIVDLLKIIIPQGYVKLKDIQC